MTSEQAVAEYTLGNGLSLHAFAVDPAIAQNDLASMLSSMDGKAPRPDLESLAADLQVKAVVPSLSGLEIVVSAEQYAVPEQFRPYRKALEKELVGRGMFNGPVMVVKGNLGIPLTLYKGGFFDFKATQLTAVPATTLPDLYPPGKTIGELLPTYGLDVSQMARYLGFAFVMLPDNGNEISFVQRAKGLGIAADIMALSGATPPFHPDFFNKGFDFAEYFGNVVEKEMNEEYKLSPRDFRIGNCYLIDDRKSVPFVAIEIKTPLSTGEIAARSYGDAEVIKEHPILYSAKVGAIPAIIQRFPLLPSSAFVMREVVKK